MQFQAVIWDMDGVLVDSGEFHYLSWRATTRALGFDYTREQFDSDFGMHNSDILKRLAGDDLSEDFIDHFVQEKEDLFLEMAHNRLQPLDGVLAVLQKLQAQNIPMAVASSSPRKNIDAVLGELKITQLFQVVLSVGNLPGKPEPDIFLEAARLLDIPAASCLVFEDSIAGTAAAKSAGMTCIAITTTNPPERLHKADLIIDRYEDLPDSFFP
ncbi:MAG: HAD family phosphatase [Anaerolineales bacterium]|nr:HAD family phosphatase [Anaerolineales bacterium]